MKKLIITTIIASGLTSGLSAQSILLNGWDFSYYPSAGIAEQIITTGGADAVHNSNFTTVGLTGNLYVNGQFGSGATPGVDFNRGFNGDVLTQLGTDAINTSFDGNALVDPDFSTSTTNPNAIAFNVNSGYFTFGLDATGYIPSDFSLALAAGSEAANSIEWEYSTTGAFGGEQFDLIGTNGTNTTSTIGTAYELESFDLSSIGSLANSLFYIRGNFSGGASVGTPNSLLALDNVQLNGAAIPEPSTYAAIFSCVALGGAYLRRRRNKAKAAA